MLLILRYSSLKQVDEKTNWELTKSWLLSKWQLKPRCCRSSYTLSFSSFGSFSSCFVHTSLTQFATTP